MSDDAKDDDDELAERRARPRRSHAHAYGSLSHAEKRAQSISSVREPAVTCPGCDTQVMPADLLAHLAERCTGRLPPGPGAKWVNARGAMTLGVYAMQLSRWSRPNREGYTKVRSRGLRGDREYLLRDLQIALADKRVRRRRQ